MRTAVVVVLSVAAVTGCYSPIRECGLRETEWKMIKNSPSNRAELLVAASGNELFRDDHSPEKHEYWFRNQDGSFILCLISRDVPFGRCFSDGWRFEHVDDKWIVRNEWGYECVG